MSFEKIAISNRGEVAVRVIRACQDMGLSTVLLHSEADVGTLAYRLADDCMLVGGADTRSSYLNIENNINAAMAAGADAIHPGFGFLSENAGFAEACIAKRMTFIGPKPEQIRLFGDKISAKRLVQNAGGPILPGYDGEDQSIKTLLNKIEEIGLPVIVKATAGGGGRGMRVVRTMQEAQVAIEGAQRESELAFGSSQIFIEKYLDHAKHIEVQIFGDSKGKIYHLFERECSVQRRHQKIIEEAPAAKLNASTRERMIKVALEIGEVAQYQGAGTIEFLYQDDEFYFMEMNTRLQVEHPVTEMILGIDLVKAQILTAQGKSLLWDQSDLMPRGHSIECRIYAENPFLAGMPSTGKIRALSFPDGPFRRFECGLEVGDEVTAHYDPMIAKVIVWDESRSRALIKMSQTLKETIIFGVHTNIPYLLEILAHPDFVDGKMTTQFISQNFAKGLKLREKTDRFQAVLSEVKKISGGPSVVLNQEGASGREFPNPWQK